MARTVEPSLRSALLEAERLEAKLAWLAILSGALLQLHTTAKNGSTADDLKMLRALHVAWAESMGVVATTQRELAATRKRLAAVSVRVQV